MTAGTRQVALAAVLAIGLTALFNYPLSLHPASVGRLNTGDGQLSIWNVGWVAHALTTAPRAVFDANIFYPHTNTLAYSEPNIGAGLLGLPSYLATGDALLAHNSAMLASFVLSFVATFGLVRRLTGSMAAALMSATGFAFCPFIFARTAHIQLMMTWGLPASLLLFHGFVDRHTTERAVGLGLILFFQALCCSYYAIFAALLMGVGTFYYALVRGLWTRWAYWRGLALAAGTSLALIAPFFMPYLELQAESGFSRTLADAVPYSANGAAWLASPARSHEWMVGRLGRFTDVLFPGFLTLSAGLVGSALMLGRARTRGAGLGTPERPAETAGFYIIIAAFAFWASFGPRAGLYTLFFNTIPIFSFLRAPSRFGILVTLSLVVLAGFFVRALAERWPRREAGLATAGVALLTLELAAFPLNVVERPPVNAAYRMLAESPRKGPVAEFPFFYERSTFPRHAAYMFNSTYHWNPLVNGYSDNIPQDFRDIVLTMSTFPSWRAFGELEKRRTRYVVFHMNWYDTPSRARVITNIERYQPYLSLLSRDDEVWMYEITSWPR